MNAAGAQPAASGSGTMIKVTLQRSVHGQLKNIAASVRGLGLRRRHQSVHGGRYGAEPRHDPRRRCTC